MMKKLWLFGLMALMSTAVMADDTQKIDASKLAKINFDRDKVILHYKDGTKQDATYDMGDAIVIDFSNVTPTAIEERTAITTKAGVEGKAVYNLKGQQVGTSAARQEKGVYIIDGKKVIIK